MSNTYVYLLDEARRISLRLRVRCTCAAETSRASMWSRLGVTRYTKSELQALLEYGNTHVSSMLLVPAYVLLRDAPKVGICTPVAAIDTGSIGIEISDELELTAGELALGS